jgi:hypothetical protein
MLKIKIVMKWEIYCQIQAQVKHSAKDFLDKTRSWLGLKSIYTVAAFLPLRVQFTKQKSTGGGIISLTTAYDDRGRCRQLKKFLYVIIIAKLQFS